jgi:lipoate-protein ligase A
MKEQWRFLETGFCNAYKNMAIDRAILVSCSNNNAPPTIRFYGWKPSAISIGYFQSLKEEVDLDSCKKLGVDYVRRITGGGAVYHDQELTYSIVISESHPKIPKNIIESYSKICCALMKGLDNLGIESKYVPINDILINGKKISGNAQTRKLNTVLQHGTILIDVDVEKMFSLLKVPNEKIKDKLIADAKERVISIKNVLNKNISFKEISQEMKVGFEKEFKIELIKGKLNEEEKNLTKKFENECFSVRDWNYRR